MEPFTDADFRAALRAHMERDGVKILPLTEATGVGRTVISKFLNESRASIRFEDALALIAYWDESVSEFLRVDVQQEHRDRARDLLAELKPDELQLLLLQLEGIRASRRPDK